MSGFCIDNFMSKASKEPKSIFNKHNLSNWKLISPEKFFDQSLASIFENIFIRYPDNFQLFCSEIIRHFPQLDQVVSTIYYFLSNNLEKIPKGFPDESEYVISLRSLSIFFVTYLNLDTSSLKFHNYYLFFNFFHIKIVTLNWNGVKLSYKSFGHGKYTMYFYIESDIFYCLYHYETENDPFIKIINPKIEKDVLFCGHRLNLEEKSNDCFFCRRTLFKEEIPKKKFKLWPWNWFS